MQALMARATVQARALYRRKLLRDRLRQKAAYTYGNRPRHERKPPAPSRTFVPGDFAQKAAFHADAEFKTMFRLSRPKFASTLEPIRRLRICETRR